MEFICLKVEKTNQNKATELIAALLIKNISQFKRLLCAFCVGEANKKERIIIRLPSNDAF